MTSRMERWLWRVGTAVLAAVVVFLLLIGPLNFLLGSVTGSTAGTRAAPCLPGREVPIMDSPHVSREQIERTQYNSVPPTSGPHFGFTPAVGIYPEPMSPGLTVHALEHGHVVIYYVPDAPPDMFAQLGRVAKRYSRDVILAPYPQLPGKIALTAWGRLELLDSYDETVVTAFVEQLRNRYVHGWTKASDCP